MGGNNFLPRNGQSMYGPVLAIQNLDPLFALARTDLPPFFRDIVTEAACGAVSAVLSYLFYQAKLQEKQEPTPTPVFTLGAPPEPAVRALFSFSALYLSDLLFPFVHR